VADTHRTPHRRACVTLTTLAPIVIARSRVTPLAISQAGVTGTRRDPHRRFGVAAAALTFKVAARSRMASLTVGHSGVIKLERPPILGAQMTASTLTSIVDGRRLHGVTFLTLGQPGVIHAGLLEDDRVMTSFAVVRHAPSMRVVVTGRTIGWRAPIRPICMAIHAIEGTMRTRQRIWVFLQCLRGIQERTQSEIERRWSFSH
jgi:hypothetical protein